LKYRTESTNTKPYSFNSAAICGTDGKSVWKQNCVSIKRLVDLFYAVETRPLFYLHDIDVFDHRCLRKILTIYYSDGISNADVPYRCCNIQTKATIVKQRRQRWLGHVLRRPNDRTIKQLLLATPLPDWRRRPGGQLKNWRPTVKNNLDTISGFRKFGRKWESAWFRFAEELAQYCDKWGNTIRSLLDAR